MGHLWSYNMEDHVDNVSASLDGIYVVAGSRDKKVYFFNLINSVSLLACGPCMTTGSE
ncbi:hypothetical protein Shell_0492 [Staphylothermus hellenicus DSM 12710]|uniref:WD-40 repeat protein n=1 Tax=Staphylothermus hellenicus (strain DSM 12710 / JCM 10830 / BK20S6-10-b1 / P8) TaxID=591019 RepID=D7DBS6_STAHD|nr:hypothetical protein Shell_0492 [Staphylothermus hellenicus DSM 12710]